MFAYMHARGKNAGTDYKNRSRDEGKRVVEEVEKGNSTPVT